MVGLHRRGHLFAVFGFAPDCHVAPALLSTNVHLVAAVMAAPIDKRCLHPPSVQQLIQLLDAGLAFHCCSSLPPTLAAPSTDADDEQRRNGCSGTKSPVDGLRDFVAQHLQIYAARSEDWRQFVQWSPLHYTRNLIYDNDAFEIIAICWKAGQSSRIHDHAEAHCFLVGASILFV